MLRLCPWSGSSCALCPAVAEIRGKDSDTFSLKLVPSICLGLGDQTGVFKTSWESWEEGESEGQKQPWSP